MAELNAVRVSKVVKYYGPKLILDELSLNIRQGSIYGLLGSSGCGKTTLLNCLVGRKNVDSGDIWILGGRPGEKASGVPGPRIGYMPQELALVDEFTVKDAIIYFGTIYKMKSSEIESRFDYLTKLLELPEPSKLLKHCSGGQKRRVSFAAALVHSPEMLILDEPTVGVDPILRQKIWDHLKDIVSTKQITVIITTHYIEETKQADTIGLMRNGKILAQESPQSLLTTYNKTTLEEVFLLLSERQETTLLQETHSTSTSIESVAVVYKSKDELVSKNSKKSKKDQVVYMSATNVDKHRMKALLNKNWKQFYRDIGGILFLLTFPLLQMWFFSNSVGTDPKGLKLGIVNNESMSAFCGNGFNWNATVVPKGDECHLRNLTCRFLTYLDHPMITKILYKSFSEAYEGVKHGHVLGVLYVPTNFSQSFEERILKGKDVDDWILNYGEMKVYMDMSNKLTGEVMTNKLRNLFFDFQKKVFADCHYPEKMVGVPLKKQYIYGDETVPATVFMAPGLILLLVYLLGSTMTSQIIVKEKIDGVWDRSIIAGVSSLEIILSHLSIQCVIMLVECAEVMLMLSYVPGLKVAGSLWSMFLLKYLVGVCGMAYGFFVSTFCEKLGDANVLCTGGYLPMTIVCGVLWPIEAMPAVLRWPSLACPCTLAIISYRNIMTRGWSLLNPQVLAGFGVVLGWILVFGIASVWIIKIKR